MIGQWQEYLAHEGRTEQGRAGQGRKGRAEPDPDGRGTIRQDT